MKHQNWFAYQQNTIFPIHMSNFEARTEKIVRVRKKNIGFELCFRTLLPFKKFKIIFLVIYLI